MSAHHPAPTHQRAAGLLSEKTAYYSTEDGARTVGLACAKDFYQIN